MYKFHSSFILAAFLSLSPFLTFDHSVSPVGATAPYPGMTLLDSKLPHQSSIASQAVGVGLFTTHPRFSAILTASQGKGADITEFTLPYGRQEVITALLPSLRRGETSLGRMSALVFDPQTGSINTGSVEVGEDQLRQLVAPNFHKFIGPEGGRFIVDIDVSATSTSEARMTLNSVIIVEIPGAASPLGGRVIPSNGALEKEIFESTMNRLRR